MKIDDIVHIFIWSFSFVWLKSQNSQIAETQNKSIYFQHTFNVRKINSGDKSI